MSLDAPILFLPISRFAARIEIIRSYHYITRVQIVDHPIDVDGFLSPIDELCDVTLSQNSQLNFESKELQKNFSSP